ncbi:hypothetical protein EON63_16335 [archaeon]|nr:MAG: hypothetical protein EON63_16335 [archaeon]
MLSICAYTYTYKSALRLSRCSFRSGVSSSLLTSKLSLSKKDTQDCLPFSPYYVVSFYKFHKLSEEDIEHILASIPAQLQTHNHTQTQTQTHIHTHPPLQDVRGTLMVANEGRG